MRSSGVYLDFEPELAFAEWRVEMLSLLDGARLTRQYSYWQDVLLQTLVTQRTRLGFRARRTR